MKPKLLHCVCYVMPRFFQTMWHKIIAYPVILNKLKILSIVAVIILLHGSLFAQTSFIHATGGTITTDGDYKIHTFTIGSTEPFTVSSGSGNAQILVVAGGGGGGSAIYLSAGGGGAGGMVEHAGKSISASGGVNSDGVYTILVGAGGSGGHLGSGDGQINGTNGGNSVFDNITAVGGGYGSEGYGDETIANPGGSGGGGSWGGTGPLSAVGAVAMQVSSGGGIGYGNGGGNHGGGGGGAGGAGGYGFGGDGGLGRSNSITGSAVTYGAGGIGGLTETQTGLNGAAHTGNGGGASNTNAGGPGANGGSGVVIIRYQYQSADGTTVWDGDASNFLAPAAANITDNVQRVAINNLVTELKSAGLWSKLKAIYPFVGGTANSHKYNLIDPTHYNLTFSGTWVHSAGGADPDGTAASAETNLTSTVLSAGNTHVSYYSTENTGNGDKSEIGLSTDNDHAFLLNLKNGNANLVAAGYSLTTPLTILNQSSEGFYINNIISGIHNVSKNGAEIITSSSVPGSFPSSGSIRLGGLNSKYSDRQCAFASIGDGLTSAELTSFNTAVNHYQVALSRNIVTATASSSQWINNGNDIYYNAGNVGIGTSTPSQKLEVNGNIYANGTIFIGIPDAVTTTQIAPYSLAVKGDAVFNKVKVKLYGNWPDYVFKKNYKLPSLDEIEKYIGANKHLPGIPSASEVKKNGIDLGDNQALLLKKIEELTLFVIEQNRKISLQAKEIKELQKKVNQMPIVK